MRLIYVVMINFQAKKYVQDEGLPSGHAPIGSFYSSNHLDDSFFEDNEDHLRHISIKNNMSFLYSLISSKLDHHEQIRLKKRLARKYPSEALGCQDETAAQPTSEQRGEDSEGLMEQDMNDLTVQPVDVSQLEEHRLIEVGPTSYFLWMIQLV